LYPSRSLRLLGVAGASDTKKTNKDSSDTCPHKKAMNIELPPVIAAFFHATNTREFADFLSLFTAEAHVNDEANDYYGAEIAAWIDRATAETKPTADVTDITRDGGQFVVTAGVSGNFPGSPVQLLYYFTLMDDKIAKLLIKA
jgi:hypothetical protein